MQKLICLFALGVSLASATPITYDISGIASGDYLTGGNGSFYNQAFDFTLRSDTTEVTPPNYPGPMVNIDSETFALGAASFTTSLQPGSVGLFNSPGGWFAAPELDFWQSGNLINAVFLLSSPVLPGYGLDTTLDPIPVAAQINPDRRQGALFLDLGPSIVTFSEVSNVTFAADPPGAVTPEPVTFALLGLGLAGLGMWRKWRLVH